MATKLTSPKRQPRLKVGDRVDILFGEDRLPALVVEDRGNIGVGGRQLIGLRRLNVPDYMSEQFELAADDVELVRNGGRRSGQPSRSRGRK